MRGVAKAASLTASLLKHELSQTPSLPTSPSPFTTAAAASDPRPAQPIMDAARDALFFAKGDATAAQFQRSAMAVSDTAALPDDARHLRLWLRVEPRSRRRMKRAARHLGQSSQTFLTDALDTFLAQSAVPEVRHAAAPRRASAAPRVKLSFRVDAARRGAVQRLAAARGCSMQALLRAALDAHLVRILGAPANPSRPRRLDTGAAHGAKVLPFIAPARLPRHRERRRAVG